MDINKQTAHNEAAKYHRNSVEVDLTDFLVILWRRRWLVFAVLIFFMAGSVVYALFSQRLYTAEATVMPVGSASQNSVVSQYASLASAVGISLPSTSTGAPEQEIMAILQSRSLTEQLVKDLDLVPLILKNGRAADTRHVFQTAVNILRSKDINVTRDSKTGVISIAVTFPDRTKAKEIANQAVSVLEAILNRENADLSTQSTKTLENQIKEQAKKVHDLQNQLAMFQKDTKLISPQGQVTNAASLYSNLLQQKLSLEVLLSRLQNTLSGDNPQVTAATAQLDAVQRQINKLEGTAGVGSFSMSNAPDQIVKYQNIAGQLDVASKIYAELLTAYQNQKLQQAQNQIFVQTIDPAISPNKPSRPNRKAIVAIGTFVGLLVGILAALCFSAFPNLRDEVRMRMNGGDRDGRRASE